MSVPRITICCFPLSIRIVSCWVACPIWSQRMPPFSPNAMSLLRRRAASSESRSPTAPARVRIAPGLCFATTAMAWPTYAALRGLMTTWRASPRSSRSVDRGSPTDRRPGTPRAAEAGRILLVQQCLQTCLEAWSFQLGSTKSVPVLYVCTYGQCLDRRRNARPNIKIYCFGGRLFWCATRWHGQILKNRGMQWRE